MRSMLSHRQAGNSLPLDPVPNDMFQEVWLRLAGRRRCRAALLPSPTRACTHTMPVRRAISTFSLFNHSVSPPAIHFIESLIQSVQRTLLSISSTVARLLCASILGAPPPGGEPVLGAGMCACGAPAPAGLLPGLVACDGDSSLRA